MLRRQLNKNLHRLDLFKEELPMLNLKGKARVPSMCGGLMTILIITVMTIYSLFKLELLVSRRNPNVSTYLEEQVLSSTDRLHLKRKNLKFAWAIEGYIDKSIKDNTEFVKTYIRTETSVGGKRREFFLDYHICTEEDFKDFPPPTKDA